MSFLWESFSFFITHLFIGYTLALVYYYVFSRKKYNDWILALLLSILGVFTGGLTEVFLLRHYVSGPEYFSGFQYFIPTLAGFFVLSLYAAIQVIKDH